MKNFKKIVGFSNYSISEDGVIRNDKTGRVLKPKKHRGYLLGSNLKNDEGKVKTPPIHRLVKLTWDYKDGCEDLSIDHINCNKEDNRIENLDWVTLKENTQRAISNDLFKTKKKVITDEMILDIRTNHIAGRNGNRQEFIKKYNISKASFSSVINNKIGRELPKYEDINVFQNLMNGYRKYAGDKIYSVDIPDEIQEEIILKHLVYKRTIGQLESEYGIYRKVIIKVIERTYVRGAERDSKNGLKLTPEKVSLIKQKLNDGVHKKLIAEEFSVTYETINLISKGKIWKEIL